MLLALIAASLKDNSGLHIFQADTLNDIDALAESCLPDTLIFDLDAASTSCIMALLSLNPSLQLIGLEAETNRALLIAGKETRSLTLDRVRDLILVG